MIKQLASVLLLLIFPSHFPVLAQEVPSATQALQNFNINPKQIEKLEQGEIVSYKVNETNKKELGIGLAIIIPAPLPKIVDYIREGKFTLHEINLISSGILHIHANISSFKKFAFTNDQIDEAKKFINAKSGEVFNLSKQELGSLESIRNQKQEDNNEKILEIANQKYREFLLHRFTTYGKKGLSGIESYKRENGFADPGQELRTDAVNSKAWAKYFPELQQAWLNYPAKLPKDTKEEFLWMNRIIEDRPTAILMHRMIASNAAGSILLSRQFYVGHSYNSSQVVAGGLPYKDGILVFYSVRSSTDQVSGAGSSVKRSLGRAQLKKEMIERLKQVKEDLK